jgi:hypothetical protein
MRLKSREQNLIYTAKKQLRLQRLIWSLLQTRDCAKDWRRTRVKNFVPLPYDILSNASTTAAAAALSFEKAKN